MKPSSLRGSRMLLPMLLLSVLFAAPARAERPNNCRQYPCGCCCSLDLYGCCDPRGAPSRIAPGPDGPLSGVIDSLAASWQMTPAAVVAQLTREQAAVVRAAALEARTRNLGPVEAKRLLQDRLGALETRVLGMWLQEIYRQQQVAPATVPDTVRTAVAAHGAGLGYVGLLVVLAGFVVVRWGRGLFHALRAA